MSDLRVPIEFQSEAHLVPVNGRCARNTKVDQYLGTHQCPAVLGGVRARAVVGVRAYKRQHGAYQIRLSKRHSYQKDFGRRGAQDGHQKGLECGPDQGLLWTGRIVYTL